MTDEKSYSFEEVKERLDEILDSVNDENIGLDEALALYEEAVGLGLRASDLLEEGVELSQLSEQSQESKEDSQTEG